MSSSEHRARDSSRAAASELILTLHQDGTILEHNGGVRSILPLGPGVGTRLEGLWPEPLVSLVRRLSDKALAEQGQSTGHVEHETRRYDVSLRARGPQRVLCRIRAQWTRPDATVATGILASLASAARTERHQRRDFIRQLQDAIAIAALRERPLSLAMIQIDGVADIAQVLDSQLARQVTTELVRRLRTASKADGDRPELAGELSEALMVQVLDCTDRETIMRHTARVSASLREPVAVGNSTFHLTPYIGVAVLGQDASTPRTLLSLARRAVGEARSAGSQTPCFFTDTLRLESLSQLDTARELRTAITRRDIRLRYVGRYDLASGRLTTWVGYLRWQHPLRGNIRPAEFLRVAETTGLARTLSQSVLESLPDDYAALAATTPQEVQLSFGPLRHHVLHEHFAQDVQKMLVQGRLPPQRLELRVAEKAFTACDSRTLDSLHQLGLRLVVDEVGRSTGSLDGLARSPIWGLQLDRSWVTALRSSEAAQNTVAQKVCRAAMAIARALSLEPIATGIDNSEQRDALLALGCAYGSGDLYAAPAEV